MQPESSARLSLREATPDDAGFMLRLLTEPSWRRFIRNHEVNSEAAARTYLEERILPGYGDGLGFWLIELKESVTPIGICGLIKRDYLSHPDLGFALLEQYWGQGYAQEASQAVIAYARETLGLAELVAISSPDNTASHALLKRLGFRHTGSDEFPEGQLSLHFQLPLNQAFTV